MNKSQPGNYRAMLIPRQRESITRGDVVPHIAKPSHHYNIFHRKRTRETESSFMHGRSQTCQKHNCLFQHPRKIGHVSPVAGDNKPLQRLIFFRFHRAMNMKFTNMEDNKEEGESKREGNDDDTLITDIDESLHAYDWYSSGTTDVIFDTQPQLNIDDDENGTGAIRTTSRGLLLTLFREILSLITQNEQQDGSTNKFGEENLRTLLPEYIRRNLRTLFHGKQCFIIRWMCIILFFVSPMLLFCTILPCLSMWLLFGELISYTKKEGLDPLIQAKLARETLYNIRTCYSQVQESDPARRKYIYAAGIAHQVYTRK